MFEAEVPKRSVFIVSPKLVYIYWFTTTSLTCLPDGKWLFRNFLRNFGPPKLTAELRNIFPLHPASIFVETWRCCFPITWRFRSSNWRQFFGHFQGPRMKLFMSENPWIQFNRWCWCVKCNKTLKRILNQWREHFWATFTRLHTPDLRICSHDFLQNYHLLEWDHATGTLHLTQMDGFKSSIHVTQEINFPKAWMIGSFGWCLVVCF